MKEEVISYVKENLAKGFTEEQIRKALTSQNIAQEDIDFAFNQLSSTNNNEMQTPSNSINVNTTNEQVYVKHNKVIKAIEIIFGFVWLMSIIIFLYAYGLTNNGLNILYFIFYLIQVLTAPLLIWGLLKRKKVSLYLSYAIVSLSLLISLISLNIIGIVIMLVLLVLLIYARKDFS